MAELHLIQGKGGRPAQWQGPPLSALEALPIRWRSRFESRADFLLEMRRQSRVNIGRAVDRLNLEKRLELEWKDIVRLLHEYFWERRHGQPGMPYTARHSMEVAFLMYVLASQMRVREQLPPDFPEPRRLAFIAGLLHDVGKYFIPRGLMGIGHNMPVHLFGLEVLAGRAPTETEMIAIRHGHLRAGMEFLRHLKFPAHEQLLQLVACHHVNFDGRDYPKSASYPKGKSGRHLSLAENMLKLCDTVSALFPRFYRTSRENVVQNIEDSIRIVLSVVGREVHPELTACLLEGLYQIPAGQSTDLVARVQELQRQLETFPRVHAAIPKIPIFLWHIHPSGRRYPDLYRPEGVARNRLESYLPEAAQLLAAYAFSGPLFPEAHD